MKNLFKIKIKQKFKNKIMFIILFKQKIKKIFYNKNKKSNKIKIKII